jgi:hypothetical protein
MALFVAVHQHPADRCPAADPQMGPMLPRHLSPENASGQGVTIQAEAVVNDAHTLYLIVEADSRTGLRDSWPRSLRPAPWRFCPLRPVRL